MHTPAGAVCPASGAVRVNNGTIEYGKFSDTRVTVTLTDSDISEVFSDCEAMGGGMCA